MANKVLKASNSRVFLIEGRGGPSKAPSYQSCFRMAGIAQGFGDINRIECPDPYNYGKFVEVAQIRGAAERVTTTLEGRYYMDLLSSMLRLAGQGCAIDVQAHLGACGDPSDFDTFTKAVVLEEAYITNYSTEDLGALQSDDNAVVNESIEISASRVYEIRPLTFASVGDSVITNEIVDIAMIDSKACAGDDCGDASDGCTTVYALSIGAGGSPGTPADIIKIKGTEIVVRDLDTFASASAATAVASVGSYLVVTSNTEQAYAYALRSGFTSTTVPTWTEVAMTHKPNGIFSLGNVAFIAAQEGYLYKMTSPTSALTTLQAGSLTTSHMNAVHALDSDFVVAVGNNGKIMAAEDGSTFAIKVIPGVTDNLNAVWMAGKKVWWVGTATGKMYFTEDGGTTWSEKSFSGSGTGTVKDIKFSTGSVGYMTHTTSGNVGRIFRTYNGGYTWNLMPEGSGSLPTNSKINKLAVCTENPNLVWACGIGVATDGVIIKGSAS